MDKPPPDRLPFLVVVAFILCSCNLILREFVVDFDNCLDREFSHLAEHGGVPDPAHVEDHEDDFVSAMLVIPSIRISLVHDSGAADLPACSRVLSPLLPPPKTA